MYLICPKCKARMGAPAGAPGALVGYACKACWQTVYSIIRTDDEMGESAWAYDQTLKEESSDRHDPR